MSNLFEQVVASKPSTLDPDRRVSVYRGRVFYMRYKKARDEIEARMLGRIVDLQPNQNKEGRLGIRLLYRTVNQKPDSSFEDDHSSTLHDLSVGPFERLAQIKAEVKVPDTDVVLSMGKESDIYGLYTTQKVDGSHREGILHIFAG